MKVKHRQGYASIQVIFSLLLLAIFSSACNNESKTEKVVALSEDSIKHIQRSVLLDSLGKNYQDSLVKRVKDRMRYYDEKNNGVVSPQFKDLPIDMPIGDVYMRSYGLTNGGNTKAVIITKKQLSFYLDYLELSGEKAIQLSFGKYDRTLLRQTGGLVDNELESRTPDPNTRHTLIVGLPMSPRPAATRVPFMRPFEVGGTKFYDDWHEIWP